ncbi:MAG: peptidoglycan DD-metalloendopeptidase family protein [Bacteroidetes bacterium]|nr:peptidoglycan DD-metalloendopeptidase family protein [Bacteroidota bacterium]
MNKRISYIVLFFCFLLVAPITAQSKKQKRLEEQRQLLLKEIEKINSLLFKTRGEKKSVLAELEDLDQRIATRTNLIRITNQQANLLTREINDNLTTMDQLREELAVLKEDYGSMISKSYKSKSQQSRLMFLLSSENFLQAYKRAKYMKQYTKHRKQQGESIKSKSEELKELNTGLIQQRKDKESLIAKNKAEKKKLDTEKRSQGALVASLKKEEGKFAKQIRSKQRAADKLDREIERIIKAAIAASNKSSGSTKKVNKAETFVMTAEAKALANNFTSNKGKLPWPVEKGVVVRRYGKKQHPQLPNVTTFSSGVEIATEKGAKARAVFSGEVFQIQQLKGANKAVYVRHGNYITIYNNLSNVSVTKGDRVTTKQEIGTVVTNHLTNKTVIKFLVYRDSNRLNPADWVYRM